MANWIYPYDSLNTETSRIRRKFERGMVVQPTDGTHTTPLNLLIYLRGIENENSGVALNIFKNQLPQSLLDQIEPLSIGVQYDVGNDYTPIFGNGAARDLLNEFDDTVDQARYCPPGLQEKFRTAFGERLTEGKTLEQLIDLTIPFAQRFFMTRLRLLESSLYWDPSNYHTLSTFDNYDRRRIRVNTLMHWPDFALDCLWVSTENAHPFIDLFRDISQVLVATFESQYRMRINEAITLVRLAQEKNSSGGRTWASYRFSWIIDFINQFTRWRNETTEQLHIIAGRQIAHLHLPPDEFQERRRAWQQQRWPERGGVTVDNAFESFLHQVFLLVNVHQQNRETSNTEEQAFRYSVDHLLSRCNRHRDEILPENERRFDVSPSRFPSEIDRDEGRSVIPTTPIAVYPQVGPLPFPRQPLVLDPLHIVTAIEKVRVLTQEEWEHEYRQRLGGGSSQIAQATGLGYDYGFDHHDSGFTSESDPHSDLEDLDEESRYRFATQGDSRWGGNNRLSSYRRRASFWGGEPPTYGSSLREVFTGRVVKNRAKPRA